MPTCWEVSIQPTFQPVNNKLENHTDFIIQSALDFDKASYKWVNDSILKVKLINSSDNLTESYSLINYDGDKRTQIILIKKNVK